MSALAPIIILGMVLLSLVVLCSTILIAIKIIKGGVSTRGQQEHSNEAKMIQEIYQGLARMEERVESLETILMERERSGKEQRK